MPLFESLKSFLPDRSDDEINGVISDVRASDPSASDDDIVKSVSELVPAAQAGTLDKQIANNYVQSKYGLQQRKDLQGQIAAENEGPNWAAGIGALGAGLAGRDAGAAGQAIINSRKQDQNQRLNAFDDNAKLEKAENLTREESDPNSEASRIARSLAIKMGVDPKSAEKLTAAKFKSLSPALEQMYKIEENARIRGDANQVRRDIANIASQDRADKADEKRTEKEFALTTPFGLANSVDDAKKLKDASEAKANFDNKIDQMIALREKHGGGATMNREDVARGKQLSKDLLLEYKNMAKLGVLSQSDEAIINAIIPEDPLEYNSPLAAVQGQDPTLARLKSFKADSEKDFANRVATRVRGGGDTQMANQPVTPKAGAVEDGYRFKGGDPKDPANWEQMGQDPMLAGRR